MIGFSQYGELPNEIGRLWLVFCHFRGQAKTLYIQVELSEVGGAAVVVALSYVSREDFCKMVNGKKVRVTVDYFHCKWCEPVWWRCRSSFIMMKAPVRLRPSANRCI